MSLSIEEYFGEWIHIIDKKEFNNILNRLSSEYKRRPICPNQSDVFKAFNLCPLNNLKIVMLGQDPYPQKGVATGILFGNKREIQENNLSPSLNIIKEAAINFEIPHNCITFDQTLESWAKQGVLMLNSALTVEMNKVGSHAMLWRPFISKLLSNLSNYDNGIVYVLFGKQAQTFKPYIKEEFNYVFEIEHPAYFARNHKKMPYNLFIDINNIVKRVHGNPIKWYEEY